MIVVEDYAVSLHEVTTICKQKDERLGLIVLKDDSGLQP